MSAFDWSEQFYKNTAKEFLLGVFRALVAGKKEFTLADVCEVTTNLRALQRLIAETPDAQAKKILAPYAVKGDKREVLNGLSAQLSVIVHSSYGDMLKGDKNDLDFHEAHTDVRFFYISLPVTAASEFFPSLGKLMIGDLNALMLAQERHQRRLERLRQRGEEEGHQAACPIREEDRIGLEPLQRLGQEGRRSYRR